MLLPGAYAIGHTFVEVGRAHQDLQHSCSHQASRSSAAPQHLAAYRTERLGLRPEQGDSAPLRIEGSEEK